MRKEKKILGEAAVLLITAFLILSTSAVMANTTEKPVAKTIIIGETITIPRSPLSMDEEALFFYDPNTFPTTGIGLEGGTPPYHWKTAIRLTSDELLQYAGWNVTAVRIFHGEEAFEHWGDIEIYDEGTTSNPGALITSEAYHFDLVEWFRIDLTTPVLIDGETDIWVACAWETDDEDFPAVLDGGPAVQGKGDWLYMNNVWQETYPSGGIYDANWGIEAIVEGEGTIWTELSITDLTGPIGVSTGVKNIGENPATNVEYELTVTGGILGRVNVSVNDSVAELAIDAEEPISSGMFFGLGAIDITVTAVADNADEVEKTASAFLLGLFVIGIK